MGQNPKYLSTFGDPEWKQRRGANWRLGYLHWDQSPNGMDGGGEFGAHATDRPLADGRVKIGKANGKNPRELNPFDAR